jgi:hypothetical protein
MFDKTLRRTTKAAIASVAQERGFYEDREERELASRVETPANDVIDKLLSGCGVTNKERRDLAVYTATMIKRVPAHRVKARTLLPKALEEVRRIVRARIAEREAQLGLDPVAVATELAEADRIVAEFHAEPPQPIVDYIKAPWPTDRVVDTIMYMTWRLITPPKWEFFITSGNPAVFEPFGLGSPSSELILPLSPRCVLHGSFQRGPTFLALQPVHSTVVKVINRRIASGVTRFAFCHEKADWILRLVQRTGGVYNPIRFVGEAAID